MTHRPTVQIITPNFLPENNAGTERMLSLYKTFSRKFDVQIVSLTKKGEKKPANSPIPGLNIRWVEQGQYSGTSFLIRGFYELWFSLKLSFEASKTPAELRIISLPFMFLLPAFLVWMPHARIIADIRDIVWEYLDDSTPWQRLTKRIIRWVMVNSLQRCELIVVTNEAEKATLEKVLPAQQIMLVSNGISRCRYAAVADLTPPEYSGVLKVLVCGNIGKVLDLQVLMLAVKDRQDIEVEVVGGGNELASLRQFKEQHRLKNIYFHGEQPFEKLRTYYESSHLLFLQVHPRFSISRPVRLYEYLSTGMPVLFAGQGQTRQFLANFENISLTEPCSPSQLRQKLDEISAQLRISTLKSDRNSVKILNGFLRENLNQEYEKIVGDLLSPSSSEKATPNGSRVGRSLLLAQHGSTHGSTPSK